MKIKKILNEYKFDTKINYNILKYSEYIYILIEGILGQNVYKIKKDFLKIKNLYDIKKKYFYIQNCMYNSFIKNFFEILYGVNYGWKIKVKIKGRGFKMFVKNNYIFFDLGFSHGLKMQLFKGVYAGVLKKNFEYELILVGNNRNLLSNISYNIKSLLPLNSYKARGYVYSYEIFSLKSGKKWLRS